MIALAGHVKLYEELAKSDMGGRIPPPNTWNHGVNTGHIYKILIFYLGLSFFPLFVKFLST
jgi:hypothetical protein